MRAVRPSRRVLLRTLVAATTVATASAAVLLPAVAATPMAGTVTSTATSTSWSGGPFVVPNTTGTAGPVICGAATPCDDFALTVQTPAGYGDTHSLKISVQWPVAAADFDVYLLDANGAEVSSAASSSDPEVLLAAPTSGRYTVRVVPFAPAGQSYTASAALVTRPAPPPPSNQPAPGYANYPAPKSFGAAHDAGEPSIGVNWNTGAVMYQAYRSTARVTFKDSVAPAQATWQDKSASAATGCPQGSTVSLDPILYTDRVTGRTFESQLAGKASLTCYTDNDGTTWAPSQGSGIASGVDHQTVGGGPFSANGVGGVGLYPDAVYYCSQDIADALCSTSRDGGVTFGPSVPIYNLLECGGLHGHVAVAPDGTVYVPNKGCGGHQAVAVSEDNGSTWTLRTVPTSTPADSDPSVSIGANGTVYFGYQNSDGHPRIAVSHDKGRTWGNDQDVGAAFGTQNSVFPAVVAGDDDRAAFTYIGTPTRGNYQNQATFTGVWHVYVATTYDGGKTWVTTDATPTDPVQKGSICTGGTTCGQDRNLLDFIGITVDAQGRPLVGYADGCTGACATGGAQNYDALATIARQTTGKRLFAAYDPLPDLTVTNLSTTSNRKQVTSTVTVANIGSATATGVVVQTTVDGGSAATSSPITLTAGQSATVTLTSPGKVGKGNHTVTATVDPGNVVKESDEGNNKRSATVQVR